MSLVVALTMMLGSPVPSSADNGPNNVDVDPDTASLSTGDLTTLTAVVTAGADPDSTGQVSFFMMPGSPNDTPAAPDFTCDGSSGSCTVSYTATNAGVDVICATSRSLPDGCGETWETDDATSTDVVQRIVTAPTATPTPTPTPTPAPTPTPTGWSFTISPSTVVVGSTTDFVARITHTSSGGNTGCGIIDLAAGFTLLQAEVTGTSTGAAWSASVSGNGVTTTANSGSGKLAHAEWVQLRVRAVASSTGTHAWAATGSSTTSCTSEPGYLPGKTAWVDVTPPVAPTATPTPTAVATPAPTSVPTAPATPAPTPVPTAAPTGNPTPPPTPDSFSTVAPTASAEPSSSDEPTPSPSPSPAPSEELVVPVASDRADGSPGGSGVTIVPPRAVDPETQTVGGGNEPAPAPAAPVVPVQTEDALGQIWNAATDGIGRAVSPEAAAQVVQTFSFPFALMLAVLLFLIVQGRVDRRDPKLRAAPMTFRDTIVRFAEETEL